MGKGPINENNNVYFKARKRAAAYNERLYSREGASELLGISVSIGLIVIGLILLTPFLSKRYAAKWKYMIWIFLSLRLLVPFSGLNGQYVMDRMSQPEIQTISESEENNTNNCILVSLHF